MEISKEIEQNAKEIEELNNVSISVNEKIEKSTQTMEYVVNTTNDLVEKFTHLESELKSIIKDNKNMESISKENLNKAVEVRKIAEEIKNLAKNINKEIQLFKV
jgi:methyl-accepting chemotaxis protein